jgi:ribosomal protein S18 acetylase RimI-like enzyme
MVSDAISIQPASSVDRADFVEALNEAYSDYYVPIHFTAQSFEDTVARASIDLDASQAAVQGGRVIGTGMLGVREHRGWVGGMGVVPGFRRRGIGRRLLSTLVDRARHLNLSSVMLEVITQNQAALALYESSGFQITRQLLVMACQNPDPDYLQANAAPDVDIREEAVEKLLPALSLFPGPPRPWQRETLPGHRSSWGVRGLAARDRGDGSLCGLCLYQTHSVHASLLELRAPAWQAGLALVRHLLWYSLARRISYPNVDENDPLLVALMPLGFNIMLRQYEMTLSTAHLQEPSR